MTIAVDWDVKQQIEQIIRVFRYNSALTVNTGINFVFQRLQGEQTQYLGSLGLDFESWSISQA